MKRLIPILVALLAWSWPALAQDDPDPRLIRAADEVADGRQVGDLGLERLEPVGGQEPQAEGDEVGGRVPATFDFRSLSTIFDTADYTLNATEDGDGLKLWTAQRGGPVAMEARASW